jgi:hypothetical protein
MARKHPWVAMRHGLQDYRRLLAAGQPDHRQDDSHAVDAQHNEGGLLDRGGNVEREFGEPERADNRNQKYEPHRKHNRQ